MHAPFHRRRLSCYSVFGPKGLVLENTLSGEVATPTYKRGFVMPKFCGKMCLRTPFYWLRGVAGPTRKDGRTTPDVFSTATLHPSCLKTWRVVRKESGATTMTTTTAIRAAAPTPTAGTPDPIQLHAEAHNALNMAVFCLRQPHANVPGARRKATQALAALRNLSATLEG